MLDQFCIRGQAVPTTTVSGSVTSSDCHTGIQDDGYFEGWRVRVAGSGSVTFEVSSGFDSYLELFRIDDLDNIEGSAVSWDGPMPSKGATHSP